jgi:hypothetical protein
MAALRGIVGAPPRNNSQAVSPRALESDREVADHPPACAALLHTVIARNGVTLSASLSDGIDRQTAQYGLRDEIVFQSTELREISAFPAASDSSAI